MEIYNYMAVIIRCILDSGYDIDKVFAAASDSIEQVMLEIDTILQNEADMLIKIDELIEKKDYFCLVFLLQRLDKLAYDRRENEIWRFGGYESMKSIRGLNSDESIDDTQILIMPRYKCIWEGKSRSRNHIININTFLVHSFYAALEGGMVRGGSTTYIITCSILKIMGYAMTHSTNYIFRLHYLL